MKMKDLSKKNKKELEALVLEKGEALKAFRFGIAGSNVRNVKEGVTLRRDIARIKTVLTTLNK
ncbi:MAG: 50S ribosomal protein L29 [Candidatus Paceibacterota bacterium]